MITMDDLKKIKDSKRRIESLARRRAALREKILSITPNLSGMPRGEKIDKMAEYVAKADELDAEYAEAIMHLYAEQLRIDIALDALPAQQAAIMRLRYVEGYGWRRIAREARYCEQYCRKIHDAALKRIK